jgi:hypothetical protein
MKQIKRCRDCDIEKPAAEFYRANGGRSLFPECKVCNRVRSRAYQQARRTSDPDHVRRQRLSRYGVTPEQFDQMLADQGGECAICGTDVPGGRGGFHVDHNHDSGAVRGLLCHACNVGIGHLGDSTTRLEAALAYLRSHEAVTF